MTLHDQSNDTPLIGAGAAMGAVMLFSTNDVLIKYLSADYALHQIVLIRSVVAMGLVGLMLMIARRGLAPLRTDHFRQHLVRGMFVVVANMSFFLALAALPLAEAVAIFFISPLVITAFSVIFLRETVGPRRWAAIAVGFLGVVVIVRPGTAAFQVASLLPILAAICYAGLHMFTRKLGRTDGTIALTFYVQMTFIVVATLIGLAVGDGRFAAQDDPSLAFFFRQWVWPDPAHYPMFTALGIFVGCGAFLISHAYRVSPAAVVAPFEYIAMPIAIFWGAFLFGEWPDAWAWVGIVLIVGSGLYILWRETLRDRFIAMRAPKYRR